MKATPPRDTAASDQRLKRTSLQRALILRKEGDSDKLTSVVIYKKKGRRRKSSPGLRTIERIVRRAMKGSRASADSYMARHERSNQKKKNGWLRDMPINVIKAQRRGMKLMKLT